jgi:serine/threonine protein kinase
VETWCLLLEFCGRGTLDSMLHHSSAFGPTKGRFELQKVLPIMRGIARGMTHLHSRRPAILHRDLKPGALVCAWICPHRTLCPSNP